MALIKRCKIRFYFSKITMNILPRNPADREAKSPSDKNIRYPACVPGHDSPIALGNALFQLRSCLSNWAYGKLIMPICTTYGAEIWSACDLKRKKFQTKWAVEEKCYNSEV
jgi:hypothetical protein